MCRRRGCSERHDRSSLRTVVRSSCLTRRGARASSRRTHTPGWMDHRRAPGIRCHAAGAVAAHLPGNRVPIHVHPVLAAAGSASRLALSKAAAAADGAAGVVACRHARTRPHPAAGSGAHGSAVSQSRPRGRIGHALVSRVFHRRFRVAHGADRGVGPLRLAAAQSVYGIAGPALLLDVFPLAGGGGWRRHPERAQSERDAVGSPADRHVVPAGPCGGAERGTGGCGRRIDRAGDERRRQLHAASAVGEWRSVPRSWP